VYTKPVAAFIVGRTAPPGKRMGHAGAIIMGRTGTTQSKIEAFKRVGVDVADKPSMVRGVRLRTLSRRRSWVQIPPPAPKILFIFSVLISLKA